MTHTAPATFRGHAVSHTYENGTLEVQVQDAAGVSSADVSALAYWFAYSHLGSGPRVEAQGVTRNDNGSATAAFRI